MPEPWQIARNRGLQTIAVWDEYNAAFKVGKLTLAGHTTDVDLLTTQAAARDSAKDDFDMAVGARDTNLAALADLNSRVPHVIENNLEEDSHLFNQFAEIYALNSATQDGTQKRAGKVISLWKLCNAERAAQAPPLAALDVGGELVADMEAMLTNHPVLIKAANDQKAVWTKKKSELRITTDRVDKNNKRWYGAWADNYPAGSVEHDALSTIDTEGGGTEPVGQVFINEANAMPGLMVDLHFHADHATKFRVMQRLQGTTTWNLIVENLEADTWTGAMASAGLYEFQVFGKNSLGEGDGSDVLTLGVS